MYEQYQDKGLEVLWVLGETKDKGPPTLDQVEQFVKDKQVTFPVLRDAFFYQVYGAVEPHSTALPHQYIIDARTMELVHASGGINDDSEQKILEILGE